LVISLEVLDAELAAATASLKRLKERALAELTEELANETNPYTREFLLQCAEKVRAIGVDD
jgi:hypothetical protein